jgi:8-oxo-dGTP pyrophosphatase MutT (NUDIX family)
MRLKLQYPNGTFSEDFIHDVVTRENLDAVVICAYDMTGFEQGQEPKIWLRSCVRPSVSTRAPFPNSLGSGWELPAGLIDDGETPEQAAVRELYEEVGFKVDSADECGRPVWGSVGISPELLYYYSVNVTGLERHTPTEDGSPTERHGECVLVPMSAALEVGDMKTDVGVYRLLVSALMMSSEMSDESTTNQK